VCPKLPSKPWPLEVTPLRVTVMVLTDPVAPLTVRVDEPEEVPELTGLWMLIDPPPLNVVWASDVCAPAHIKSAAAAATVSSRPGRELSAWLDPIEVMRRTV
jgi:hypothetical protein